VNILTVPLNGKYITKYQEKPCPEAAFSIDRNSDFPFVDDHFYYHYSHLEEIIIYIVRSRGIYLSKW